VISEPELTGGFDDDGPPADVVADFDSREPRPAPRPRPPWVWVLGAVLVTSAVWAAGTYAYDRGHDDRPKLYGYRIGESPCVGSTLKPLLDAIGANSQGSSPAISSEGSPAMQHLGSAVDQTRCDFSAQAPYAQGGTTTYTVAVSVELHKQVDPRVEFDDRIRLEGDALSIAATVSSVPELGDEAYFLTRGDQGQELKILHGGAVIALFLNAYSDANVSEDTLNGLDGGPYPLSPDLTQYQPALIQAARNIMSGLQRS
jgi:hypothetical protein